MRARSLRRPAFLQNATHYASHFRRMAPLCRALFSVEEKILDTDSRAG
jgi:hypothetical protein